MEIIDIKDYFKISDDHSEVRGFIEVKDSTGRTVFVKENMITETGREYIKNLVYAGFKSGTATSVKLKSIHFNKDGGITNSSDSKLHGTDEKNPDIVFLLGKTQKDNLGYTFNISDEKSSSRVICFTLEISKDVTGVFREAGLFLSNGNMFSRVAFAPLTLKADNTYTINYYIYF